MRNFQLIGSILLLLFLFPSCDVVDSIRTWGERERRDRVRELSSGDVEQWERDLKISKEHIQELNRNIQQLVQESTHHGRVSWLIAKAYMEKGRYRMAEEHYRGAFENQLVDETGNPLPESSIFNKALPYYREALRRNLTDPDLLFDAGLCYANSSRDLGWEEDRWETAVLLFDTMRRRLPKDPRPLYQLALLYAKTEDENHRDPGKALEYLEELLGMEPTDVAARFALAHIVAETGDLSRAREETLKIISTIEEMHQAGILSGKVERHPSYVQARKNVEMLDACIEGRPDCEIFIK